MKMEHMEHYACAAAVRVARNALTRARRISEAHTSSATLPLTQAIEHTDRALDSIDAQLRALAANETQASE